MPEERARGFIIGLWILTGLAFLTSALFPGSTGAHTLGPLLLALATLVTALPRPTPPPRSAGRTISLPLLQTIGLVATISIALTIIQGDQRSFFFVVFSALLALALGMNEKKTRRG